MTLMRRIRGKGSKVGARGGTKGRGVINGR